jgi:hypothetical protein
MRIVELIKSDAALRGSIRKCLGDLLVRSGHAR